MVSFVLLSLIFIGGIGGLSFLLFQRAGTQTIADSREALVDQIKENIDITADKNSQIINEKLSSAEAMVQYQASELEYIFSNNSRYGKRDVYYDYVFEYNQSYAPADLYNDIPYGVNLSWDYASYYLEGSNSTHYKPEAGIQNVTLEAVASMDYVFQYIHDNAPEFRWLYIAFELQDVDNTDLFINYPGSILMEDDILRNNQSEWYEAHTEDWYIDVYAGNGEIVFTEPYTDEFDGVPLITIGRLAKFDNGTLDTGYASLITTSGLVVAHPDPSSIPTLLDPDFKHISDIETHTNGTSALSPSDIALITSGGSGILEYKVDDQERYLAYQPVGKGDYISLIIVPVEEALEGIEPVEDRMLGAMQTNLNTIWIIVGASFAIGITVGLILTAYITKPFTHLIKVAQSLSTRRARKDIMEGIMTDIDPDLLRSEDELGELTRAFKGMIDSVQQAEREKDD
jgi:HAMP domain-containing protein